MPDTVYSARPALHAPRAFLQEASADLRRALPLGRHLFAGDLRARHRRAWLGYAWLLLPSLAGVALCMLVQSRRIVVVAPTELPYPLFVLSGIVLWQVFVDALTAPLAQLSAARRITRGQRVPHEAFMIAAALDTALSAAVRLVLLVVALPLIVPPTWSWLLLPAPALVLAVTGLAIGLFAAPFGLLYDDVRRGLQLLASVGMFLSPVLYPVRALQWSVFNPTYAPLGVARAWLLGAAMPLTGFVVTAVLATACLVLAWLFYRIARPHVVARLG